MKTENDCSRIHVMIDRFLDNELSQDEAVAFSRHMQECPELSDVVSKRTAVRDRLRTAVKNTEYPAGLELRIRQQLAGSRRESHRNWSILAIAAALLLTFGLTMSWRTGGLRFTPAAQESYIASIEPGVSPAMQIGLRQHVHCAVFRKHPAQTPGLEEIARNLGTSFAALVPAMQHHLPGGFRVVEAHICNSRGRIYTHLTATNGTRLISLLVTDRAHGEALESDLRAVATEAGEAIYTASVQRFNIAGFETRDHLVYLVSDMDSRQNLTTLDSMVPEVARTIRTLEI